MQGLEIDKFISLIISKKTNNMSWIAPGSQTICGAWWN